MNNNQFYFVKVFIILSLIIFLSSIKAFTKDIKTLKKDLFPIAFDITGKIDRLSDIHIVVDDVLFELLPSTTYFCAGKNSYVLCKKRLGFSKNHIVGIILKDKKNKQVRSLWLF